MGFWHIPMYSTPPKLVTILCAPSTRGKTTPTRRESVGWEYKRVAEWFCSKERKEKWSQTCALKNFAAALGSGSELEYVVQGGGR